MGFIKRNKMRHYVEVGSHFVRVGFGFSRFDESKKPNTSSVQYFHEAGERTGVVCYSPEILYEFDAVSGEEAVELIRGITDRELVGDSATVRVLTVDMTKELSGGAYPAVCHAYSVLPDASGGEDVLTYRGKLVCASPATCGTFTPQSGIFSGEVS